MSEPSDIPPGARRVPLRIELALTRPPFSEEAGFHWVVYPETLTIRQALEANMLIGPFDNELEAEEAAAEIEIFAMPRADESKP